MGVRAQYNQKKTALLGQNGNSLVWIIGINAIVFGIISLIKIGYALSGEAQINFQQQILPQFLISAAIEQWLTHPWTLLTYMFSHVGIWSLLTNMLWFWSFGQILQLLSGNRHVAPVYLYGGLAGGLFFLLLANAIPALRSGITAMPSLFSAGSSVMAVAIAATATAPGYRIFPLIRGGIPLWVLTLIFILLDVAFIANSGYVVVLSHLAGGAVGFAYIKQFQAGRDWGKWMHRLVDWFLSLFDPAKTAVIRPIERKEAFYIQGKNPPFKKKPQVTQQRIDDILDKINQKGYQYLSEEEKEYLKNASKEEL